MRKRDAHSWTAEELQDARDKVASLHRKTANVTETARSLGVSRQVVYKWLRIYHTEWDKWRKTGKKPKITARKRGKPKRRGRPPIKRKKALKAGTNNSLIQIKLYRIGDIAKACGLSRQTIHNYTKMGLIKPSQITKGDHRLYSASAIEIVRSTQELKKTHTLQEVVHICQRDFTV